MRHEVVVLVLAFVTAPAWAQSSASFRLTESTANAGGRPSQGQIAASARFRVSVDAIGSAAARVGLASAGFRLDTAFVPRYRPPGEVTGLRFSDATTLAWNFEPSIGTFNVYRGLARALPGDYGACLQTSLTTNSVVDVGSPTPGSSYTYLVTAENRLREEGTLGSRSDGAPRPNTQPCP